MALDLAVGDLLEVRFFCQAEDQVSVNVRHWDVLSTLGTSQTVQEAATAFDASSDTIYKGVMPGGATYRGVGVRRLTPDPTLEFFDNTNTGPGTAAGDTLPGQTSGLVKLLTESPGRSGRGRIYAPFPGEGDNGPDGKPTAGYMINLTLFGDHMVTSQNVSDGGGNEALLGPKLVSKPSLSKKILTASLARDTWASQRRRRIGVAGDTAPV